MHTPVHMHTQPHSHSNMHTYAHYGVDQIILKPNECTPISKHLMTPCPGEAIMWWVIILEGTRLSVCIFVLREITRPKRFTMVR